MANKSLQDEYPHYGKEGRFLNREVSKDKFPGKGVVIGPKGDETPLYKADGRTINPKISKTDMKVLGSKRKEMIQQKDVEIEESDKNIQEDQRIANDENEEPVVRKRAREKVQENTQKKNELVNEREQL